MKVLGEEDYEPGRMECLGGAHYVSNDPDPADEAIAKLHDAVKEVTGNAVEPAPRPRMGFLP